MDLLRFLRNTALLLAVVGLAAACDGFDSGVPPSEAGSGGGTTLAFSQGSFSRVEDDSTITISVTIRNPSDKEVSAEILYADGASTTSASDFNLPNSARVEGGNAYVVGSVSFPASAESGDTRSVELVIKDDEEGEDQEEGIFVLQKLQNASVGTPERLSVNIGAITLLSADFSEEELAPMTAVSVASNEDWGVSSAGGAPNVPYAVANGFGANEPSNDWLITPAINFNEYEGETLTFISAKGFNDNGLRGLQVKVSTDYDGSGNPENFTWIDVSDQVTFSQGDFNFVNSGDVDLSGDEFQGESVYIAFQYRSSGTGGGQAASWEVDNIVVNGR